MLGICGDFICLFAYGMYIVQLHQSVKRVSRAWTYRFNHMHKGIKSCRRVFFMKRNQYTQKLLFVLLTGGNTTIFPSIVTLFHRIFYKEILQQINQIKSGLVILHISQPTKAGCMPQSLRIYALRKSSAMPFRAELIPTSRFLLWKWL